MKRMPPKGRIKNIIIIIIIIIIFCLCSWYETHYTREATVINVTDNIITVIDKSGYVWKFEGIGFNKNDKVRLIMNTMLSNSNVLDDKIENVKKINK